MPRARGASYGHDIAEAMPAFALPIQRADDGTARFALRVSGAEDGMRVFLRDLPEPARPTRGMRENGGGWALKLADLEDLRLTLGEGTPEAFDVTIVLAAADGRPAAARVAHVRVLDPPQQSAAAVADEREPTPGPHRGAAPAQVEWAPPKVEIVKTVRRPVDYGNVHATVRMPQVPKAPAKGTSTLAKSVDAGARVATRPPGASGLGAVSSTDDRQVWWKMPMPDWAPFPNAGR